jgi:imidazolonepropionase-like amidohydrolase
MVTVNAAGALGQGNLLGQIRPGFYADLIAIPEMSASISLFERIVSFEATVPWIMVSGDVRTPRP